MHRSSIFSFDTYRVRTGFPGWLVVLLALVIMTELALRVPAVTQRLPAPELLLWHSPLIQTKFNYLKTFESTRGIDILFIGNSTVQAGVNPQVFDASQGEGVNGPGAFNGSVEGLPPYGTLLFLEIWMRYTTPEVIIYGMSPQDLNSNSPWARDITDRVKHSPLAWAEARRGIRGRVTAGLLEHSAFYRYRSVLYNLFLRGGTMPPVPDVYFDTRGYHSLDHRLADIPAADRRMFYNKAGVLNYSPRGEQMTALEHLIQYCDDNGIQLILVNMPLADEYYSQFDGPGDYQEYLSALTDVARGHTLPLWDMENLPASLAFGDTEFADLNHLNHDGAQRLSSMMAEQYTQLVAAGRAQARQQYRKASP